MKNISDKKVIYDNAIEKLESGDYPAGIYGLYQVIDGGSESNVELDLAEAYFDIGSIQDAQKFYIRVLDKNTRDEDAYLGMINCFIEMGEQELANYYFIKGIKEKVLDKEKLDDYFTQEVQVEPPIKIYDSKDKQRMVDIASKLLVSGDEDYAEQILKSLANPDIKQYTEVCALLALLYIKQKRFDEVSKFADKILQSDDNDVFGYVYKIIACYNMGFDNELKEYIDKLLSLDTNDEQYLAKVAACMMTIGDSQNAKEYLQRQLALQPFAKATLIGLSLSCAAQGEFSLAKRHIVTAHRLFPEDVEIKYYAHLIREQDSDAAKRIMQNGLDSGKWLKELENFMVEHSSLSKIESALKKNPDMRQKLTWLEQCPPCKQQMDILSFFAQSDKWREQSQRLLLLPDFDLHTKKLILKNMLITSSKKDFSLYTCGILRKYRPKKLQRTPLADAYYTAYTTMAFVDSKFDKKLFDAYKVVEKSEISDIDKIETAAAVMFYLAGGVNVIKSKKDCAEIFGVKEEDFMKFVYKSGLDKDYEFK